MKKNMKKSKRSTDENRRVGEFSDFSELNKEIGSFGIEPPKIYNKSVQKGTDDSSGFISSRNADTNSRGKKIKDNNVNKSSKNKIKRKRKKKLRSLIRVTAVILGAVVILTVLSLTVLFKIDTISVSGNSKYTNQQILSVISIEKGDNLFLADIKTSRELLLEKLPYIRDISIKRKFPSTITLNVTETKDVYYIKNKDNSYTLLDGDMKVLETKVSSVGSDDIKISRLSVSDTVAGKTANIDNEQMMSDITALTAAVESMNLGSDITEIYSVDMNNNYMVYNDRIVFKLGSVKDIEDKVYKALAVCEKQDETAPDSEGTITITDDKKSYFTPSEN